MPLTVAVWTLMPLSMLAPQASAASAGTWATEESGPLTGPGLVNSYFSGNCTFAAPSGGTGQCLIDLHFQSATYDFACTLDVTVSNWTSAPTQAGGPDGFWLNSGTVTASAPTSQEASQCATRSVPVGATNPSTGEIVSPIDTLVPFAVGTYLFTRFGQLQAAATVQVTFTP